MFKTGIYTVAQLKNQKKLKTIFGKDKRISITLYNELLHDPQGENLIETVLLQFTDARGAYKRTYANRFEEFDRQALQEIQNRFLPDRDLVLHDVAISDGRTACDFFEKANSLFPKLKYYASDYDPHIYSLQCGKTKAIINREGILLEIVFPPFVFNLMKDSLYYPINHVVRFMAERTIIKKMIVNYKEGLLGAEDLFLFCPRALKLAQQNSRFVLMQYNLLSASPLLQTVDALRAMNILNLGYFTPEEYKEIVHHMFNSLSDKGLLITGSNQDSNSIVHGGIFQKNQDRFEKIWQSGDGSPVETYILNYRP